jgi:hypothetical protein
MIRRPKRSRCPWKPKRKKRVPECDRMVAGTYGATIFGSGIAKSRAQSVAFRRMVEFDQKMLEEAVNKALLAESVTRAPSGAITPSMVNAWIDRMREVVPVPEEVKCVWHAERKRLEIEMPAVVNQTIAYETLREKTDGND